MFLAFRADNVSIKNKYAILLLNFSVVPQLSNQTVFPYSGSCEETDQSYDTRAIVVL